MGAGSKGSAPCFSSCQIKGVMHKKPSAFRWDDLLSFGGVTLLSTSVTIFITTMAGLGKIEIEGASPWMGVALCWTVALSMAGIYGALVRARAQELKPFIWVAHPAGRYAFMIHPGDYDIDLTELHDEVLTTVNGWEALYPEAWQSLRKDVVWVWFKPWPIENLFGRSVKVAGVTVSGTHKMLVGFKEKNQPLKRTAFAHELGHIIQGFQTGDWRQDVHHARSKELGLP